eukprot:5211790-Alexandrium_andersonii.AAC.1
MAEAKSEETSSSPAVQTVDDAPPVSAPDSALLIRGVFSPWRSPRAMRARAPSPKMLPRSVQCRAGTASATGSAR